DGGCGGGVEHGHGEAHSVDRSMAFPSAQFDAPGTRPRETDLRHVEAPDTKLVTVHMPSAISMAMHRTGLLDRSDRVVWRLELGGELRCRSLEGVDAHCDVHTVEKLVRLEEAEGEAVLPNHQLRCRDQGLQPITRLGGERSRRCPPADGRDRTGHEQKQHTKTSAQHAFHAPFSSERPWTS